MAVFSRVLKARQPASARACAPGAVLRCVNRRIPPLMHAFLGVALGALGAAAQATDEAPSLDDLLKQGLSQAPSRVEVSTASRFSQSAAQSPSVVYVLTAQDIQELGLRSVGDVLRSLPGLYVTTNTSFTYVAARGLAQPGDYNSRLLVLLDGMRLNENLYDAAQLGRGVMVDIQSIERVEFAPGPGSAVYGNNAFFGVINIITKRVDHLAGIQAHLSYTSRTEAELALSYGHRSESGAEWAFFASALNQPHMFREDGEAAPLRQRVDELDWDAAKRIGVYASQQGLTFRAGLTEHVRGWPIALSYDELPELAQSHDLNRDGYASITLERRLNADWDTFLGLQGHRSYYAHDDPYIEPPDPAMKIWGQRAVGEWHVLEARVGYQGWDQHWITAGLEYQANTRQHFYLGTFGGQAAIDSEYTATSIGAYIQDEWKLSAQHSVVLGARADHFSATGDSVNPRLAWVWSPGPDTGVKLLYGSAYRGANRYEVASNAFSNQGPPASERVRSLELAVDHAATPHWRLRASAFVASVSHLIRASDEFAGFTNGGVTRSRGIELGVEGRFASGGHIQASLDWTSNHADALTDSLNNQPKAQFKLNLSYPLGQSQWRLGGQLQGVSARHGGPERLAPYVNMNLNLSRPLDANTDLAFGIYNLADREILEYTETGQLYASPQESRVLRLTLTRRFGS